MAPSRRIHSNTKSFLEKIARIIVEKNSKNYARTELH